jgi:hypothetical protein
MFGYLSPALLHLLSLVACPSDLLVVLLVCRRLYLVPGCGGSYAHLFSFYFASLGLTVLILLVGAHFVFSVFSTVQLVCMHSPLLLPHRGPLVTFRMLCFWCFA